MRSDDSRRARDPYRFFLLTFVLALPLYGLATFGSVGLAVGRGANLPLSALVFLCPLGAALLLVARREGAGGVGRLLRRLLELRSLTGWWWVPTLLLLPALYWLSFWCHRGLGLAVPGPSFAPLAILTLTGVFLSSAASEE